MYRPTDVELKRMANLLIRAVSLDQTGGLQRACCDYCGTSWKPGADYRHESPCPVAKILPTPVDELRDTRRRLKRIVELATEAHKSAVERSVAPPAFYTDVLIHNLQAIVEEATRNADG